MSTQEIADKLVAYCRKADWEGAHKNLYARSAKSIEPYDPPEVYLRLREYLRGSRAR